MVEHTAMDAAIVRSITFRVCAAISLCSLGATVVSIAVAAGARWCWQHGHYELLAAVALVYAAIEAVFSVFWFRKFRELNTVPQRHAPDADDFHPR